MNPVEMLLTLFIILLAFAVMFFFIDARNAKKRIDYIKRVTEEARLKEEKWFEEHYKIQPKPARVLNKTPLNTRPAVERRRNVRSTQRQSDITTASNNITSSPTYLDTTSSYADSSSSCSSSSSSSCD